MTGSARPANHQPVESEEPAFRENGNVEWANKAEVVKESIAEEDEGELIPPPQAFCNSAHQGQDSKYTLSQPMSQVSYVILYLKPSWPFSTTLSVLCLSV